MFNYLNTFKYIIVFTITGLCFYWYVQVVNLKTEKIALESEIATVKVELEQTKKDLADVIKIKNELDEEKKKNQETLEVLMKKVNKFDDIADKAIRQHPVMMDKVINNSIENYNNCIEKITRGETCDLSSKNYK